MGDKGAQATEEAERELVQEREFLAALVGSLEAGVIACDAKGQVLVTNATFRHYGDYRPEEVAVGSDPTVKNLFWPDGRPLVPDDHPLRRVLRGERVNDCELVFYAGGRDDERVVNTSATVLKATDGRLLGAVAAFHDITQAKKAALELTELALHDPLTRCANRLLLSERAETAIALAKKEAQAVALLLIDLDNFKQINDEHGHLFGDEVLIGVGKRLRSVVRPNDTVARYGGDEFVLVFLISGGDQELTALRERVAKRLAEPFRIGEELVALGASIGAGVLPGEQADLGRLLHLADADMYKEKLARRL
jgi:diguanylate cyclase (GGDEF)-like protein/PAS domain S-box-containing protein